MEFYDAWEFLLEHKMFKRHFRDILYIMTAKVNPDIGMVDDDESKNTKVEVWLEVGPWSEQYHTHDWDLDCGGDTFEEAIIKLADLVKQYYNDDGTKKSELNTSIVEG
jgi:hypothetical protein